MATDSQDSRRKHHHSSGDEAEETSKRRKHRHHHRRHHHHHRHSRRSSRKHDEGMREKEDVASSPPPSPIPVQAPMVAPDYDMEEGEIVEEEEGLVVKVKGDSEAESGEIETRELPHGSDAPNLGVDVEGHTSYREAPGELGHNFVLPVRKMSENSGRISEILGEDRNGNDMAIDLTVGTKDKEEYHRGKVETSEQKMLVGDGRGSNFNGHVVNDFCEEENRLHTASSPSENTEGGKVSEHSLSHAGYRKRVSTRKRSRSCDRARSRSQSQIILEEAGINDLKRDITHFAGNNRDVHDSDDKGLFQCKRDYGSGSKDMISYEVREHETGYGRYSGRGDGHHNHEARDRYRGERDRDRDRDREQDRDGDWEMEKDRTKQKERAHGSTEVEKDIRREKERVGRGDKDREREREWDRSRDRDRESEKERNRSRDREREKERGRSRDRDREREKERNRSRDREREKERDGSRELVKERDKDREEQRRSRDRASERERVREKERERGQSRDRDRGRYSERDKVHKNYKYENIDNHSGDRDNYKTSSRHSRHDEIEYHRDRTRKSDSENVYDVKNDSVKRGREKLKRDEDEQEDYLEKVASQLAEQEEEDLNRIKEESRRRRQAILEKYNTQPSKVQVESHSQEAGKDNEPGGDPAHKAAASSKIVTPEYADDRSDRTDAYVTEPSFSIGKLPGQNGLPAFERTSGAGGLGEGTPKSERSEDMFCDDIFGESPAGVRKSGKGDGLPIEKSSLNDNWDDAEGYYSYRFGEILDGRYEITAAHGKGVFSAVVRAKDLKAGNGEHEEVAIKMIRNNDTMYKAGMQELIILKKLVGADPGNRRRCVRFISNFKYRNHLCLVFESLHMNLREVLKKFGRNIGLKLTAVRAYAKQLFIALKHLRNCGVLHCDIKPDNMLVNDAKNVLKLCDFGNAMFAGKNEITPYLVSRFYRAPEIILGLPYDHPLDIWSVGCCLYELYTGKVLFPGPSNNDMLRLHMELKGPFPKKMLRKGAFIDQHFDQDLNFHATEEDPVTKKTIKRLIINIKPKDIGTIITGSPGEDPKMLANFKDLLDKIFVLDPEKRMTVSQALNHPFITGK